MRSKTENLTAPSETLSTLMDRRRLMGRLAAAGFSTPVIASILADSASAQDASPEATPTASETLASVGKDPENMIAHGTSNFETQMDGYDAFLTPNDQFYVRSNGPLTVDIDPAEWRLKVTGLVNKELELSLDDLKAMGPKKMTSWLECSGNSRSRFGDDPEKVSGTQWTNGAVGNAEWTGVPLADILEQAGVKEGAVDVVSQGGDFEDMKRGLPIEVAFSPDIMVVWEMNGEDLPNPNGGPVRLLVPGWGGIASTKWLVGIDVIDHAFEGHFNVESYLYINEQGTVLRPVRELGPKSVITNPVPNANLDAGSQTISGFAWSGWGGVAKVEVSVDGGETWEEAMITDEAGRHSWYRFEYDWDASAGDAKLQSRCTDERALVQPTLEEVPWNVKGYGMNAIYEVPVTVK